MLCKMCCSVGYNDGHTPVAIWNQTSWFLLCSTETHIWKTPVPHFSALPVPTQTKYRVEVFGVFGFIFCAFYSVNSLHIFMQRRVESCQPNQNFSWHHEAYLLHFAVWSYQHSVCGAHIRVLDLLSAQNYLWAGPVHWHVTLDAGAWRR